VINIDVKDIDLYDAGSFLTLLGLSSGIIIALFQLNGVVPLSKIYSID
jgi:hypothetical protein